jgi:hypothetical protein
MTFSTSNFTSKARDLVEAGLREYLTPWPDDNYGVRLVLLTAVDDGAFVQLLSSTEQRAFRQFVVDAVVPGNIFLFFVDAVSLAIDES